MASAAGGAARSARTPRHPGGARCPAAPWQHAPVVEIRTERLTLRSFLAEDLRAFVAYRSDPEVARYQSWDATYSLADGARFLASQRDLELGEPGEWVQLAAVAHDGRLAGDCAARVVQDPPRTAEIGVTFSPRYQGAGLATEALAAVVTTLFREHAIHRVYAHADDHNLAVQRLLERLGFRCEARLIDAEWFKGGWSTVRIYAVLEREWHGVCLYSAPAPAP